MKINSSKKVVLLAAAFLAVFFLTNQTQAAPGDLDPSFGSGGIVSDPNNPFGVNFRAAAVAIQSDGKIVTAGNGGTDMASGFGLARYNPDGSLDTSFGSGGRVVTIFGGVDGDDASAVAIQSDGKIVAVGYSRNGGIFSDFLLARYNPDGSLDPTFGSGGKVITPFVEGRASTVAIQADGKIVAAGQVGFSNSDFALVRYNANGSLDASFGAGGIVLTPFSNGLAWAVAIQSIGKIVAVGSGNNFGAFALARYNTDGSLDPTFGSGGKVTTTFDSDTVAWAVAIQSDGKIVAAGRSTAGSMRYFALTRYNTDGSLDPTFGSGGKVVTTFSNGGGTAYAVAIQSDRKIVVVGAGFGNSKTYGYAVARYNPDGSLDSTFGLGGRVVTQISDHNDAALAIAIQSDGKIVAAGNVGYPTFGVRFALVRYQASASSFAVTRSDDRNAVCVPGDCSLREAVNAANASGTDDTINFAPGLTTITLSNEIVINNAGTLTIDGPGANNLTIDGGAGTNRIFYINQDTVTISGLTLTGGDGTGANNSRREGGAIYVNQGLLTLDGVHVTGNTATGSGKGGGVYFSGGTHRIINSTISANNADICGGLYNDGTLSVVNSTISGNTVYVFGGGFCQQGGSTTLRNVTITKNTTYFVGGGIYLEGGAFSFGNTIVAGNTSGSNIGPEFYFEEQTISSAGYNSVGDSPGDSINTGYVSAIAYQPTDIRDTDPLLGTLQDNGGATPTHALLPGSPIIDKARNAFVSPTASAYDQRGSGFARIRDGNGDGVPTVDIGAFEVQLGATGGAKPTPFDFDGDGRGDLSVFRPSDRTWYLNRSQDGFSATQFGLATDKLTPADYDGDGKTDIAVYRDGTWYLLRSTAGFLAVQFGLANDIPQPADFDGDGRAELAVYRNGTWWTLNLSNNQVNSIQFGLSTDKPVVADYDGDGRADQAVYRNVEWHLNLSSQGYAVVSFGLSTDKPVPADYDGDGKIDVAVFRPSEGNWYVRQSASGSLQVVNWGFASDALVPADYDGDGSADFAVYRGGMWYIRQTSSGISCTNFGLASDMPVNQVQ